MTIDDIVVFIESLTWQHAILATALSLSLFFASMAFVLYFLTRLPANYFHRSAEIKFMQHHARLTRWVAVLLKNIAGILLVLLGAIMAVPGVPGQGLLTVFVGLMLVNFPGKRAIEISLISRPRVLTAINRLRARFSKPPFTIE